ncbi:MAG: MBL fold metallo-hydrolase [Candidatus Micrarchaeia archaeon]|jgi:glyoxylase-like metal-dependent hydrolase (beta-lactamase superfamily II)
MAPKNRQKPASLEHYSWGNPVFEPVREKQLFGLRPGQEVPLLHELNAIYKNKLKEVHPDKGGPEESAQRHEEFIRLGNAYDKLIADAIGKTLMTTTYWNRARKPIVVTERRKTECTLAPENREILRHFLSAYFQGVPEGEISLPFRVQQSIFNETLALPIVRGSNRFEKVARYFRAGAATYQKYGADFPLALKQMRSAGGLTPDDTRYLVRELRKLPKEQKGGSYRHLNLRGNSGLAGVTIEPEFVDMSIRAAKNPQSFAPKSVPLGRNARVFSNGDYANSYVFAGSDRIIIVDPGFNREGLMEYLEKHGDKKPVTIVATHSHYDHVADIEALHRALGKRCTVCFSHAASLLPKHTLERYFRDEEGLLSNSLDYLRRLKGAGNVRLLKEGDKIANSNFSFKVFETPGHTNDSLSLLDEKNRLLVSGDSLEKGYRTDFPNSDPKLRLQSIQKINAHLGKIGGAFRHLTGH